VNDETISYLEVIAHAEGIDETIKAFEELSGVFDDAGKSAVAITSKFEGMERRLGTTAGQAQQFAKGMAVVNAAVAQGNISQERADEVASALAQRYGQAADATGLLTKAHGGLDIQAQAAFHSVRSFAESVLYGIPPTQALTGQLNHLSFAATGEGGIVGAFSRAGGLIGGLVTPMAAAVGGVAALAAGALYLGNSWDKTREQTDLALIGMSQRTGTTAADIANFAKSNSSAFGLSIADARNVATEFTKTGEVTISSLHGVGDAIHGYALLTGTDATEATKAFSDAINGDMFKGIEGLNQRYGALDATTLEYIQTLVNQGDKTAALQAFMDATSEANKRAAESVGGLSAAWQGFKNIISGVVSGPAPTSNLDDQIKQVQAQIQEAQSRAQSGGGVSRNSRGELVSQNDFLVQSNDLQKEVDGLQAKLDSLNTKKADAELTNFSAEAFKATNAIFPQIDAMQKLQHQIDVINDAQDAGKAPSHSNEAVAVLQQQYDLQQESLETTSHQAEAVNAVKEKWGDVGVSTAKALQESENQLPVLQAVGGAQKMAAQYAADYANYMLNGKTATEAAALAGATLAASQAQVNSAAQEQLAALQDQYAVASARNVQEGILAQGQATYNQLLREGVDSELALSVASQQVADNKAKVYEQNQKSVKASQDQLDLIQAQGTGTEAMVKSSIAYDNAIQNGATSAQAAAIAANTFAAASEQAAVASQKAAEAWENAARAVHDAQFADITPGGDNSFGFFQPKNGIEGNTAFAESGFEFQQFAQMYTQQAQANPVNMAAATGSIDAAISSLKSASPALNVNSVIPGGFGGLLPQGTTYADIGVQGGGSTQSDITNAITQLYDLKASSSTDNATKASAYNDEIAYLQSQPQTIDTLTKIADLKNSIQQLTTSTDNLTAVNQDLLSPYYSQDPRTSHIGFRSQGMASGGEFTVPGGYSANDNMMAQIPVASGEVVSVRRPGQNLSSNSQSITINLGGITVNGGTATNANAIGRTVYQALQTGAKQLQAAAR